MRDLAYKALQAKEKLMKEKQKEPTIEEIAKEIGAEKEEIVVSLDDKYIESLNKEEIEDLNKTTELDTLVEDLEKTMEIDLNG